MSFESPYADDKFEDENKDPESNVVFGEITSAFEDRRKETKKLSEEERLRHERIESFEMYESLMEFGSDLKSDLLEKYDVDEFATVKTGRGKNQKIDKYERPQHEVVNDLVADVNLSGDKEDMSKVLLIKNISRVGILIKKYLDAMLVHVVSTGQNTKEKQGSSDVVKSSTSEMDRRNAHHELITTLEQIYAQLGKLAEMDEKYKEFDKSIKSVLKLERYPVQLWAENVRNEMVSRSLK